MKKLTAIIVAMMMVLSIVPLAFAQNETTAVNDTAPAEEPAEPTNDTAETPAEDTANETAEEPPAEEETPANETAAEEPAEGNETAAEEPEETAGNETVEIPEEEIEEAGTTPDSFLWNIDLALERLDLLLTFDEAEEARKELENARERLLEVQAMVAENDVEAAAEAQAEHDETMAEVEETIESMGNGDGEQELAEQVELEEKLNEHKMLVQKVGKTMLKTKGLTAEQQTQAQTMFESMAETADGAKLQIQAKKNKTKIKIKAAKGMTDEEISALEEQARTIGGEGAEVKITGQKPKKAKKEKGAAEETAGNETSEEPAAAEEKTKGKPDKEDKGKPDKEDKGKGKKK